MGLIYNLPFKSLLLMLLDLTDLTDNDVLLSVIKTDSFISSLSVIKTDLSAIPNTKFKNKRKIY
jgi:hypothetical protein